MRDLLLVRNAPWLASGALLTLLSSFGQTIVISVCAADIQAEFSLSHGAWGGIYALGTTTSAVVMVWAGGLTDKFRVRALGPVVLLMLAMSCLLMAFNPFVWLLPVVIFALRLCGQGMTSHIAVVAMARWFDACSPGPLPAARLPTASTKASPNCCSTTRPKPMATARSLVAPWSARMRAT